MEQPFDPKLPLDVVAEDWGCTVRHIRNLEKRGKIKLLRLSRRMTRMPLSEKLRYEKNAQDAPADAAVGERLRLAREAAA
jgi:hypothetical protein